MLVLARKNGESIRIADDIVITIIAISRGRVRIGISAHADVPVYREELYRRIEAERRPGCSLNQTRRLVDVESDVGTCGLAVRGSTTEEIAAVGALA